MVKDVEKIILLNQGDEPLPFNVREFRCISYDPSSPNQLKRDIVASIKAVAEQAYRFKVRQESSYQFPHKVMGPDHCAYDFSIPECYLAVDGAKFMLCINRYVVGEDSAVAFQEGYGLNVGERRPLPGINWDLQLESVDSDVGRFALLRRPAPPQP